MSPRQDPQKLKPESLHRIARWGSGEQRWLGDCYTSTLKYVLGLASDWWVARASDSCFTTYVAERRLRSSTSRTRRLAPTGMYITGLVDLRSPMAANAAAGCSVCAERFLKARRTQKPNRAHRYCRAAHV